MPLAPNSYDAKLQSILRIAAGVFAEKGYHQASIRDISRATHVSLSGLYYYFQSKEELLFLIEDHTLQSLIAGAMKALAPHTDPVARLEAYIDHHVRFFVENMAEMKVLAHEADSLSGEFRSNVDNQKRYLTRMVREILRQVSPASKLDERVAAFALFGMVNWIYAWYDPARDVGVDRLARELAAIFIRGFAQPSQVRVPGKVQPLR